MVKVTDEILTYIYTNWQNIVVAFAIAFIFFILSTYGLKKYITSAERERLKQAQNSLLDILESRIVSKQDISIEKINNLLRAIDREHFVVLSDAVSPRSLLQDLELRFEESRQLDSAQKDEYCKQIEKYIQDLRKGEETFIVPQTYSKLVETLAQEIETKNTDKALATLESLKRVISERKEYAYAPYPIFEILEKKPYIIIFAIIFYYFLFKFLGLL